MFKLEPIEEELKLVKLIYSKYHNLKSVSQVEKYLLSNNIKTRGNSDFANSSIVLILKNTACVKTNNEVMDFLESMGITVLGTPDNEHGMLTYKKRKGKSGEYRDMTQWVCAIAKHKGIIDADTWLSIQNTLKTNASNAPNFGKSHTVLLSGLMRCAKCNSPMKIIYGSISRKTGLRQRYYVCTLKYNSGAARCNNPNAKYHCNTKSSRNHISNQ